MWQGPNNGVLAHTDISDAGFVAERRAVAEGFLAHRRQPKLLFELMLGPRKNPSASNNSWRSRSWLVAQQLKTTHIGILYSTGVRMFLQLAR